MKTIVFASRKGGAGKTTLASHVAVEAHAQGAGPVALMDLDPMGGLAEWFNARSIEDGPQFARVGQGGLKPALDEVRKAGFNLVVVDTPPASSDAIAAVIRLADVVVVPIIPSPNDLRAISDTLEMIEAAGKPMEFVINSAALRARLTAQAVAELSQHGPVSPVIIRHLQDYRSAMIDGRVAREVKATSQAAADIWQLWVYLESKLNKLEKKNGRIRRVA